LSLAQPGVGIVLVGGKGTRLGQLTGGVPKPLFEVRGRPFLHWVLSSLESAGISQFVLAAGYQAEAMRRFASDRANVSVVVEPSALGTAGALRLAAEATGEADPLLVANGDSLVAAPLGHIWEALDSQSAAVMVAVPMSGEARYGRIVLRDGFLSRMDERSAGNGAINAGIYALRRDLVMTIPSKRALSLETDVLPKWLAGGVRVRVLTVDAPFIDIGVPSSLALADSFVDRFMPRISG